MKQTLLVFLLPALAFAGSINLDYHHTTEQTDAAPVVTRIVDCSKVKDVVVFVTTDKGTTITVTPLPYASDTSYEGPVSSTETIADGGGKASAIYSNIGAPLAKVVVTKTEAGATSGFALDIRGVQ